MVVTANSATQDDKGIKLVAERRRPGESWVQFPPQIKPGRCTSYRIPCRGDPAGTEYAVDAEWKSAQGTWGEGESYIIPHAKGT